ncbi:AI-2E family transporter [Actinocorallia sp. API 0066]|uniref:AI-2E family transporter n=1 Tax=Actinocorallia sp. API 0066 TaxID=2896846 RepID=UPI001E3F2435|nr:AI-2E family transporter [Actinocorallia sp. API 0066]MCD0451358.1 AI-2E family transporter [Actinocorallia sp. API 0066]
MQDSTPTPPPEGAAPDPGDIGDKGTVVDPPASVVGPEPEAAHPVPLPRGADPTPRISPDPLTDLSQRHREAGVTDLLPFGTPGRPLTRSPFVFGFTAVLGGICAWLLVQAVLDVVQVLILLTVSLFLAVGLNPAVERLVQVGLSRGKAVTVVFLAVVLFFTGVGWAVVPPVVNEISKFAEHVPEYIVQLQQNQRIAEFDQRYNLLETARQKLLESNFQASVADWALNLGKGALSAIFNTFTVLILTLYFLAALPQMKNFFYRFTPRTRRARVALLGDEILDQIGGYVSGAATITLIASVTTYIFLSIVGVPYAAVLALIVGLTGLIPMVGATIGGTIVTLVGFLTGVPEGIACGIFFVLYQQVENYFIYPRIMQRSVNVQPVVTVIAALIGGSLMGITGALLAIPVAAAISLIIREVVHPRQDAR